MSREKLSSAGNQAVRTVFLYPPRELFLFRFFMNGLSGNRDSSMITSLVWVMRGNVKESSTGANAGSFPKDGKSNHSSELSGDLAQETRMREDGTGRLCDEACIQLGYDLIYPFQFIR